MVEAKSYFSRLGSTIFGIATAPGSLVTIFRISGERVGDLAQLVGPLGAPNSCHLKSVQWKGLEIDRALVLSFHAPNSFTGENVVEIQCHGMTHVVECLQKALRDLGYLEALPGEFSFRAFRNSKISLAQAERLHLAFQSESIGAQAPSRLMGFDQAATDADALLEQSLVDLSTARGRVEAAIDFPEAAEEQSADVEAALKLIEVSQVSLNQLIQAHDVFSRSLGIPRVVIVGEPNVGKSSLLNFLCGGARALVADEAGTTRDYLEVELRLPKGRKVRLLDTAGVRFSGVESDVERLGVSRALELANSSDVILWLSRAGSNPSLDWLKSLEQNKIVAIQSFGDLWPGPRAFDLRSKNNPELWTFLEEEIESILAERTSKMLLAPLMSTRQRECLDRALEHLGTARRLVEENVAIELVGDSLHFAEIEIQRSLGRSVDERYIEQIFGQFCLGK
jgi:tRNA modification GTPase